MNTVRSGVRRAHVLATLLAILIPAALFTGIAPVHAQYPNKPIRFILPFPPGGGTDTLARILGGKLAEGLAQQVILDNRPGAGANIGAELAAKAPPDGYTLLMGNIAHTINMTLYRKLNYNFVKDFSAVSLLASAPNIVVVHPSVPAKSIKELVALARARPGALDYASSGSGSSAHLAAVLMLELTKTQMNHIPYKGGGPAAIAAIGGQTQLIIGTTVGLLPHVRSGKLRAIAVTSPKRTASAPEIPTFAESGAPGYDHEPWNGLLAPAKTPTAIVAKLNAEVARMLGAPEVKKIFANEGAEAVGNSPEAFAAIVKAETAKWAKVIKTAGIKID